jgi:hypothetical protein
MAGVSHDSLLGFIDQPQAARFVSMVNKDGVELTRWSHGSSELVEVFNHKNVDIVFQMNLRDESSGTVNVRSSSPMPVRTHIPADHRMPVVVLERKVANKGWTWNFDWRWDVFMKNVNEPKKVSVFWDQFASKNLEYVYNKGVGFLKYHAANQKTGTHATKHMKSSGAGYVTAYQVVNLRDTPIVFELEFLEMDTHPDITWLDRRPGASIDVWSKSVTLQPQETRLVAVLGTAMKNFDTALEALKVGAVLRVCGGGGGGGGGGGEWFVVDGWLLLVGG